MQLLPAIDIRGGKAVRLQQGDYARETIYGDDPAEMAERWVREGGDFLHLVDLDGAKEGRPINTDAIRAIVARTGVPCELGGGLRSRESIEEALALGVTRAIIGTEAVRRPEWFAEVAEAFPGRLVLGLDARDGMVATHGWLETSALKVADVVARFEPLPLAAIVFTDIAQDGMLTGPNVAATAGLQGLTRHEVIASGGIGRVEHVVDLARAGVRSAILGRSLYEGAIRLPELIATLRSGQGSVPA
jgi:phosphoribosylformimino-5-aminoimidazole carboxamide ribotide isomerase